MWHRLVSALSAAFVCAAASLSASAAPETANDRSLVEIRILSDYAFVEFGPDFNNTQNCVPVRPQKNLFILNWKDEPNAKTMLAGLMMAYATNSPVDLSVRSCHPIGYPEIYRVDLKTTP